MRNRIRDGSIRMSLRRGLTSVALTFGIAALCLLSATGARGDLETDLQLYNSMSNVTTYVPPAFWEDVSGNDHVSLENMPAYFGGTGRETAVDFTEAGGTKRTYVNNGDAVALDPGTGDYSVSLWYNESVSEDYNYLLTNGNAEISSQGGYSLATVNGVPRIRINDINEAEETKVKIESAGGATSTGNWHHLVAVFDRMGTVSGTPDTVQLYIDNIMQGSTVLPTAGYDVSTATPMRLCVGGRSLTSTNDFEGYMDDVAIYGGALNPTDVNMLYTATSLDASTITSVAPLMIHNFVTNRNQAEVIPAVIDEYGSHDGTIYNGAEQVTEIPQTPPRGKVLEFEGTPESHEEYVNYGDVLDPGTGSYTVSLWCKLTDTDATGEVLAHKGMYSWTGQEGWSIFLSEGDTTTIQIRVNYDGTTTNRIKIRKPISYDNQWHHVAMVIDRDEGVVLAYLDGLGSGIFGSENDWEDASDNGVYIDTGEDIETDTDLVLGNDNPDFPLAGRLDDFAVWTRALTDQEILDIYNGTSIISKLIPGDTNKDGIVNATDAEVLGNNWGRDDVTGGAEEGDFNGDGYVNAKDASILAANWGDHNEATVKGVVPEPTTLAGLLIAAVMCLLVRRRSR